MLVFNCGKEIEMAIFALKKVEIVVIFSFSKSVFKFILQEVCKEITFFLYFNNLKDETYQAEKTLFIYRI